MIRIHRLPPTMWWCIQSQDRAVSSSTLKAAIWRWRIGRRETWIAEKALSSVAS